MRPRGRPSRGSSRERYNLRRTWRSLPNQEAMSRIIQISSSDTNGNPNKNGSHEEVAETNPDKLEKMGSELDHIRQTVDVLAKALVSKSPEYNMITPTPANPDMIMHKLFTPPSSKSAPAKVLRTVQTPGGYYIGQSLPEKCTPSRLIGKSMQCPWWLSSLFKPARHMDLTNDELAVAAYIFGRNECDNLDPNEILIRTTDGFETATRRMLKGLRPGEMIEQEILNILVSLLTDQEAIRTRTTEYWFLPTVFSQCAETLVHSPSSMVQLYGTKYMSHIALVKKIFIPVNEDNMHWFLMVVDLYHRQIIILDSFPSQAQARSRFKKVQKVAFFLEDMQKNEFFFENEQPELIPISDWPIVKPIGLSIQKDFSNDCGIFVAAWMVNHEKEDYMVEVDDGTRLKLALDIVLGTHNDISIEVKTMAIDHIK